MPRPRRGLARYTIVVAIGLSMFVATSLAEVGGLYPHPLEHFSWSPVDLLAADLDDDGNQDLVVVSSGTDEVSVLCGNGDGTFADDVRYAVGSQPGWMTLGDFDADGHDDLAVANFSSGDLSVLMGQGDGTFEPETRFGDPGGDQPTFVAAGDFNEDGKQDLIMTQLGGNVLFPGNGDGTFGAAIDLAGASWAVAVADFNGDDHDDFAIPGSVLLGNGDFSFSTGDSFPVSTQPTHIANADLDGDAIADLVLTNRQPDEVSVRLGNGDGTFGPADTYSVAVGAAPSHVSVLDHDYDSLPDLIVSHGPLGSGLSVLIGSGGGQFDAPIWAELGIFSSYSIAAADFNGDGVLDIAHGEYGSVFVGVILGAGDGTFVSDLTVPVGDDPQSVAVADLDGDGRRDLVTANVASDDVSVVLADGAGTFEPEVRFPAEVDPRDGVVTELSGDGIPDLAITNSGSDNVSILIGDGTGFFTPLSPVAVGDYPVQIESGDLNGDQDNDLVVSNQSSSRISVLLGNGDGTFVSMPAVAVGSSPRGLALGDVDGDEQLDVVVAVFDTDQVAVRLGNGDGTFTAAPAVTAGFRPEDVSLGDLDGDQLLDLAIASSGTGNAVEVLRGNGDGTFTPTTVLEDEFNHRFVTLVDLDNDGALDLVTDFGVMLFGGNGDGTFQPAQYFAGGVRALGDFNLDDRIDLANVGQAVGLLLNQSGPQALSFLPDGITLVWPAELGAWSYNVYRGALADLVDADDDGLPDGGYGNCVTALDDDAKDTFFVDPDVPASGGSGLFYLRSVVDAGGEHAPGTTSAGLPRQPQVPCP